MFTENPRLNVEPGVFQSGQFHSAHADFGDEFFQSQPQFSIVAGGQADFSALHAGINGEEFAVGRGKKIRREIFALAHRGHDDKRMFLEFLVDGVFVHAASQAVLDLDEDAEVAHDHKEAFNDVFAAAEQYVKRFQCRFGVALAQIIGQFEDGGGKVGLVRFSTASEGMGVPFA